MTREQEVALECARDALRQAELLPSGPVRDALLEKARQYEKASTADDTDASAKQEDFPDGLPSQVQGREAS